MPPSEHFRGAGGFAEDAPAPPERTLETGSEEETRALGERLGKALRAGDVLALLGDLGTGKTVLAKGILAGLGGRDEATSPSFTLVNVYEAPLPVYHLDFYRLGREEDVESLGFRDLLDGRGVVLVEWADRVPTCLPADRLEVTLRRIDDRRRALRLRALGPSAARALERLSGLGKSDVPVPSETRDGKL
jgi:tRNA threonylcarbamoyladenosine biosynthesis protein TsaE